LNAESMGSESLNAANHGVHETMGSDSLNAATLHRTLFAPPPLGVNRVDDLACAKGVRQASRYEVPVGGEPDRRGGVTVGRRRKRLAGIMLHRVRR